MNCGHTEASAIETLSNIYYDSHSSLPRDNAPISIAMSEPPDTMCCRSTSSTDDFDFDQSYRRLVQNANSLRGYVYFQSVWPLIFGTPCSGWRRLGPSFHYNSISHSFDGKSLRNRYLCVSGSIFYSLFIKTLKRSFEILAFKLTQFIKPVQKWRNDSVMDNKWHAVMWNCHKQWRVVE